MELLRTRDRMMAPDAAYMAMDAREALHKERATALIIGAIALFLAFGVALIDGLNDYTCRRISISHYYYEPLAGGFFVAALAFTGAFLLRYRGETRLDGALASVAGVAAILVALFPTTNIGCLASSEIDFRPAMVLTLEAGELVPAEFDGGTYLGYVDLADMLASNTSAVIHSIAAIVLFAILLYFSAWSFTRVRTVDRKDGAPGAPVGTAKKVRNGIYVLCSLGILAGFALVGGQDWLREAGWFERPMYLGEAAALASFGVAWLVKSRLLLPGLGP
ncbi:hypothetical protein [Pseudoroseicyclus tamaricis]|uniref:DUF998 domain-containing protein n=1 Tax=Pseudoroseicyclus tamaricis TaxID=2705421 RepID=A0A6B2JTP3_9RHOB|nr:hypothetical protein [Pseudoroseicyclus tamaricis]NDV01648.1 hypothetical protein [Pseudoroseicyclus tamaricis]